MDEELKVPFLSLSNSDRRMFRVFRYRLGKRIRDLLFPRVPPTAEEIKKQLIDSLKECERQGYTNL